MNIYNHFHQHVLENDSWLDRHPHVFQSELEAIREVLPHGDKLMGIEVGLGTGRFAKALGIKEGIEPSQNMREAAAMKGILTVDAVAEHLPYRDLTFDFLLMVFSICFFKRIDSAFNEASRVLKNNGALIIGFIDKESTIGQYFQQKANTDFYEHANLHSVEKILNELTQVGFRHFTLKQTLFGDLDKINSLQPSLNGYGKGSFIVIKALKNFPLLKGVR